MPKRKWSEQERKDFGAKMKALREAKQSEGFKSPTPTPTEDKPVDLPEDNEEHIAPDQNLDELMRQIKEVQETNALLKAALLGSQQSNNSQSIGVGRGNKLVGEVEKYLVDPNNYPDPTPRLKAEGRLAPLAFDLNYELDYKMDVVAYETKTGINMREPKFHITLNRVVRDEQGQTTDKRYIARRLVFHEDPQAAIVIARENGLEVDTNNEKLFLDEMRYLRVRDWLFDIFWPRPPKAADGIREEVIGGTIVQVFTKSSEESSGVDFDKLDSKITV